MGRTVKDPNRRLPKPVQKVWLSEKNVGRRILLVVLLLAIGSGFLVYGFMKFLHGDSGWREISVKAGADLNCGEDFTEPEKVADGFSDTCMQILQERGQHARTVMGTRNMPNYNIPVEVEMIFVLVDVYRNKGDRNKDGTI